MESNACSSPWFEHWFDRNYLLLYQHRDCRDAEDQVDLIARTLPLHPEDQILDLGCGDGRYTHLFQQKGFRTTGLDLSMDLISEGRKRYGRLNFVRGDMRAIPGFFTAIFSLFTSFGYFESHRQNLDVLASISLALVRDGWFWLDFLNPTFVEKHLEPRSETDLGEGCRVLEERRIENGRIVKDITFSTADGSEHYQESVALYHKDRLEAMLESSGLTPQGAYGDYRGVSWESDSPRTIIFSRKEQ